jgi:hypothetical protein
MSEHAANTSFYWSCHHDNLPELDRAKKDYEKDRDSYDAKHALSVAAMTRLRLLGYNDLANELRAMSDMMHSGLERLEEEMSEQEREAEFYALRGRFSKAGEKFYEEFRKRYDDEPELGRFWRRPFD